MVTNLHLLEAIQVSHTSIGKLQDKQVHIEKITKEMYSQMEEWFTYMRAQTKTLQGEVGEAKEELEEVRAELVEVRAELAEAVALLGSTSTSIQQSQQAQAQAHAQVLSRNVYAFLGSAN